MLGFSAAVQRRAKLKHEIMLWIARNHSVCTMGAKVLCMNMGFSLLSCIPFLPPEKGNSFFHQTFFVQFDGNMRIQASRRHAHCFTIPQFFKLKFNNGKYSIFRKNKFSLIVQGKTKENVSAAAYRFNQTLTFSI